MPDKIRPEISQLLGVLNVSGIQKDKPQLYQVIAGLIQQISDGDRVITNITNTITTLLGSGPVNTVLHGEGSGNSPEYAPVSEPDLSFTDITTANSSITAHGLLAKTNGSGDSILTGNNAFVTKDLYQATPADPTGTTSLTGVMMGLAGVLTPISSSRIAILISGNLTNSGATAGQGSKTQIRFGTGTAPASADALTGTVVGSLVSSILERNVADLQAFSCHGIVTGLTAGVAYWIDLGLAAITSGTGQAKNISITAFEL